MEAAIKDSLAKILLEMKEDKILAGAVRNTQVAATLEHYENQLLMLWQAIIDTEGVKP